MTRGTSPNSTFSIPGSVSIRRACLGLLLVTVAVWPLFACVGYARSGLMGILAALLAAGVCGGGALASLLATGLLRLGGQPVAGVLLGMLIRMAVPLAACMVLLLQGGPLVEAGALVMILVYYLLMLAVETFFLVRLAAAGTTTLA